MAFNHLKIHKGLSKHARYSLRKHRKSLIRNKKRKIRKLLILKHSQNKKEESIEYFIKNNLLYYKEFNQDKCHRHTVKDKTLGLFNNTEEVFNIIFKIIKNKKFHFVLDFNNAEIEFGALFFIDTMGWHLSKHKIWRLCSKRINKAQGNLLQNMRTLQSQEEDYDSTFIINEPVKMNAKSHIKTKNYDKVSKRLRELTEEGLRIAKKDSNYILDKTTSNTIHSIVSEQFDNINEHAKSTRYGDICATYNRETNTVSVLICNFGPTIYDSFTKNELPVQVESFIQDILKNHLKKGFLSRNSFTEENIFTLLSLQAGVSSLLEADETRGYGLIDFIEHCFNITNKTRVVMISGNTTIKIDNKYPISEQLILGRKRKIIALNKENDIHKKPDKERVVHHDYYFPGVIIETTLPLNELL